tara:strand:- start:617 stop:955 length:339 start_codon:yes stop_codon:yes gene_type:complete
MDIAKMDLEIKKLTEEIKKNRISFIENYNEIISHPNKYMNELKNEYKKEMKRIKDILDYKIIGLMDIVKHLESISGEDLSGTEKNELRYDIRIVLEELDILNKEKDLLKNII